MSFEGGAAAVVSEVFSKVWGAATARTEEAAEAVQDAIAHARPTPRMQDVDVIGGYDLPDKPQIDGLDPGEMQALYDSVRLALEASLGGKLEQFLEDFFPDGNYYSEALSWLERTLAQGGSGINADVERQLWERDRSRILGEMTRTEDETMATWAARRFPLPPGALAGQVNQIRLEGARQLAAQSRDIAIKAWEAELENVRQAVQQVLDLRVKAVAAAGDYIKTLMLGPQLASELAMSQVDAKIKIAQALTSLYASEVAAQEPAVRMVLSRADIKARVGEANLRAEMSALEARVQAAMAYAQMLGAQAAAGVNGLHASAAISGSDTTQRVLEG